MGSSGGVGLPLNAVAQLTERPTLRRAEGSQLQAQRHLVSASPTPHQRHAAAVMGALTPTFVQDGAARAAHTATELRHSFEHRVADGLHVIEEEAHHLNEEIHHVAHEAHDLAIALEDASPHLTRLNTDNEHPIDRDCWNWCNTGGWLGMVLGFALPLAGAFEPLGFELTSTWQGVGCTFGGMILGTCVGGCAGSLGGVARRKVIAVAERGERASSRSCPTAAAMCLVRSDCCCTKPWFSAHGARRCEERCFCWL